MRTRKFMPNVNIACWSRGMATRFPHPPARGLRLPTPYGRGVGKPGFPTPLAAPPHTDGMKILPGRAAPQTLPRAGVWGNLVPPFSR